MLKYDFLMELVSKFLIFVLLMIAKLIMKIFGWKVQENLPAGIERCVMIAAPHTSNWDLLFMMCTFKILKIPVRFTIKDSWFRFPFNIFFSALGGIPINRKPALPGEQRESMVEAMAKLFADRKELCVVVTPEGTRSRRDEWKSGFYHVASLANVPIGLGYLDYKKKIAGVHKLLTPSGNMENDLREIMSFYKDIAPKHPEKFSLDKRFI